MHIDSEPASSAQQSSAQAESAQAGSAQAEGTLVPEAEEEAEGKGMIGAHEPPAAQLPPSDLERCASYEISTCAALVELLCKHTV